MTFDLSELLDALIAAYVYMDNIILTFEGIQFSLMEMECIAIGCGSLIELITDIINIPFIDEEYFDYED